MVVDFPAGAKVDDFEVSKRGVVLSQVLHPVSATHKSDEPVSRMTLNGWGLNIKRSVIVMKSAIKDKKVEAMGQNQRGCCGEQPR
jgi:hypothetical protein